MKRMKHVEHSQAFLRKRRLLLVLPLLVIPFLTLFFWAVGGGRSSAQGTEGNASRLNLSLPNAALRDEKGMDKLSFYDLAQRDSNASAERTKNDPYLKQEAPLPVTSLSTDNEIERITGQTASRFSQSAVTGGLRTSPYSGSSAKPEEEIMQKLLVLQKELNKPANSLTTEPLNNKKVRTSNGEFTTEVDRLEQMMVSMTSSGDTDPEMNQLESTLDKVLDVQHPERVRERMRERSQQQKGKVFPMTANHFKPSVSLLDTAKQNSASGQFYSLEKSVVNKEGISVGATVHRSQVLVEGAVIKLRLTSEVLINGIPVPEGCFVYGIVSLNGERLQCEINSIRLGNQLLPVKLQLYNMDGLPGIYVPGTITRDVAKNSVDNAAQMLEITSLDPSLKAQATSAGLGAIKTLLSKKVKLVKVTVKEGYKVLLKDKNAEQ